MKLFNQISSIIIALLFVFTINFKSFITINYFFNQTEIAELFCINKEKPQLQCEGKCHLATELSKVDIEDEQLPFNQNSNNHNNEISSIITESNSDTKNNFIYIEESFISEKYSTPCKGFYTVNSPPPKV